jgi:hypothetical protein
MQKRPKPRKKGDVPSHARRPRFQRGLFHCMDHSATLLRSGPKRQFTWKNSRVAVRLSAMGANFLDEPKPIVTNVL